MRSGLLRVRNQFPSKDQSHGSHWQRLAQRFYHMTPDTDTEK